MCDIIMVRPLPPNYCHLFCQRSCLKRELKLVLLVSVSSFAINTDEDVVLVTVQCSRVSQTPVDAATKSQFMRGNGGTHVIIIYKEARIGVIVS